MDLISLRWTLCAADHSSFRGAAKTLGVGQAALSRRVRALEDEIGVSIFERRREGVRVTNAGHEFLARVGPALSDIDYAAQLAKAAGRAQTGSLKIAFYHSLVSGPLQNLLASHRAEWPNVKVEFVEMDTTDQLAALRDRRIDIGFLFAADEIAGVDSEFLWSESEFAAMPANHPLAEQAAVRWADLREERVVMRAHQSGIVELACLVERLKTGALEPNICLHHVSREGLFGLVAAGHGVTVVTKAACGASYPGVAFRIIDEDDAVIPIRMAWIARNDNPALRRFLSHVRACVKSMHNRENAQLSSF